MTPAPRTGTEFAGYRIEGLVARGGMGVVYRAEHPRLGATVALKVMDPELATDEVFRERFVREARAASRVTHPHIVPIYDAGEWDGELFIAMRYIEGDDLRSLLRKSGALSVKQTSEIGHQVASALDAAHRAGLIHRDVKPANILVAPAPQGDEEPIAYLGDLGLTKYVDSHTGVTESGALLGTIDYMAPEQISGEGLDRRADIYSLACVLFECLTGTVPYARENPGAVVWAHLHEDVPRATALNPALPPGVDDALSRGMAKSPDDRFSTARDLISALQGGPGARPKRRGRPSAAMLIAAALGLLLGGAAVAGVASLLSDDETTATPTAPEGQSTPATTTSRGDSDALTPFDVELMRYVPDALRARCRHAAPPIAEFDAAISCKPGGVVSTLLYTHARSGFHLADYFVLRMTRAGLTQVAREAITLSGSCSAADIPAVNTVVPAGLSRRFAVPEVVLREERLGFVLCYRRGGSARIEWITNEIGVYAAATGKEFGPLYEWWRTYAGPEA